MWWKNPYKKRKRPIKPKNAKVVEPNSRKKFQLRLPTKINEEENQKLLEELFSYDDKLEIESGYFEFPPSNEIIEKIDENQLLPDVSMSNQSSLIDIKSYGISEVKEQLLANNAKLENLRHILNEKIARYRCKTGMLENWTPKTPIEIQSNSKNSSLMSIAEIRELHRMQNVKLERLFRIRNTKTLHKVMQTPSTEIKEQTFCSIEPIETIVVDVELTLQQLQNSFDLE